MDIEVHAQQSEVHPRWRTIIDRRAAKLAELCKDIQRLHVTMVHSTHHLQGSEEVRMLATVPNDTLRVQKQAGSMGDALHAAFTALEHELHTFVQRRRGD